MENEFDADNDCLTDDLHNRIYFSEDDMDEQERFLFRQCYGSIYIDAEPEAIERLRDLCIPYKGEFKLSDGLDYSVTIYNENGDKEKVLHYPKIQPGKRPLLILIHTMKHEKEEINKKALNVILKINKAPKIGDKESIVSSVLGNSSALNSVLPYFFDIQPNTITYLGSVNDNLTRSDLDILEKFSI